MADILKKDSRGFLLIDVLIAFMGIVLAIELLGLYLSSNYKLNNIINEDFDMFKIVNQTFFGEGMNLRYEEMIEKVLSY